MGYFVLNQMRFSYKVDVEKVMHNLQTKRVIFKKRSSSRTTSSPERISIKRKQTHTLSPSRGSYRR